jgi:acyl-CoA thioester hydrolase
MRGWEERAALADPTAAFVTGVRVYFQDTDAGGIVYHARYLDFLERCRMDWLRSLGHPVRELEARHGVLFIVHAIGIDYLRPGRLEDALQVELGLERLGGASLELRQRVTRDGEVLVSAQVRLACVDAAGLRPARIPPALRERLGTHGRTRSGMTTTTTATTCPT